ncbi:MAG: hypothetical protein ACTSP2_06165 [Alphaproteobacteria bacterium]
MAVPAYLFVQVCAPLLPIGLGFAAGAMIWMVFAELVPEAARTLSGRALGAAVTLPFILMPAFQLPVLA